MFIYLVSYVALRYRSLASLNMDEFMAYSSSEDGGEMGMMAYWPESSSVKRTKITTMHMSKASLEDNSFLQQGDENLLNVDLSDFSDTVEEEEEEGVGMVEPRPLFITSYKHKVWMNEWRVYVTMQHVCVRCV